MDRVKSYLDQVQEEYIFGLKAYENRKYETAINHLNPIPKLLENAFVSEIVSIRQKIDSRPGSSESQSPLREAKDELELAKLSYRRGDHKSAYKHVRLASEYAEEARIVEQSYLQQPTIYLIVRLAVLSVLSIMALPLRAVK